LSGKEFSNALMTLFANVSSSFLLLVKSVNILSKSVFPSIIVFYKLNFSLSKISNFASFSSSERPD